jgi:exopolysaccharide production protein ExoY
VPSLDLRYSDVGIPQFRSQAFTWKLASILERLVAAGLLVLSSPILVLAAVILASISRRSPLVAHQRVGQGGRAIWVLKLRTMWTGVEERRSVLIHRLSPSEAPVLTPKQKHLRVTSRFAAFCRRYSIDEIPQLWNVICGDMALVGPRPMTQTELDIYYGTDGARVIAATPGITGLWQISGRSRLTYKQRRRLDLFLLRNWSLPLYARILFVTIPRVLVGKDAW